MTTTGETAPSESPPPDGTNDGSVSLGCGSLILVALLEIVETK